MYYNMPPNFSPYMYPPPPTPEPMTYKQYRKMYRKWERDWKEKDKDAKPKNGTGKKPALGLIETFALLSVFGLPIGAGYLLLMNLIAKGLFALMPH